MISVCKFCKNQFKTYSKRDQYCNRKCMSKGFKKPRLKNNCNNCGIEFTRKYWAKKAIKCSVKCNGNPDILKKIIHKPGFWKTATYEQKIERYKQLFEKKVIRQDGCWDWNGYIVSTGYGRIGTSGQIIDAHRFSYILHKGEIPQNLWVLHRCSNAKCTNPEHLYLGTAKQNTQDMLRAGRNIVPIGEKHPGSKLTLEKVKQIKELIKEGKSSIEIGLLFSVSKTTINDIKRNNTWKGV